MQISILILLKTNLLKLMEVGKCEQRNVTSNMLAKIVGSSYSI